MFLNKTAEDFQMQYISNEIGLNIRSIRIMTVSYFQIFIMFLNLLHYVFALIYFCMHMSNNGIYNWTHGMHILKLEKKNTSFNKLCLNFLL